MPDILPPPIRISDDIRARLSRDMRAARELDAVVPDSHARAFARTGAKLLRNHLPPAVLERLTAFRFDPAPCLTLRNLPGPRSPVPTPTDGFGDERTLTVPNLVHFGLLDLLGLDPVAFPWENAGRLVRNVAPRPGSAAAPTSWGSAVALDWHTDDSVLDHRPAAPPDRAVPHHLSFYGMRNDEGVPTDLLPLTTVLAALDPDTAAALRRPEFTVTAPPSYATAPDGAAPPVRRHVPVLWTLPDGPDAVRYGPGRVTGETPPAARALERFAARLAALPAEPVLIAAGDFHVFDNRRVLHRRVPFTPAAPGAGRWLRRAYARRR